MRTIFLVLLLLSATHMCAQLNFGYPNDEDTILPIFETALENEVYEYLLQTPPLHPRWKLLSLSPVSIKMWSEHAGWDIIALDPGVGKASGFIYDFSWNATELAPSAVEDRLIQIATAKQKGPR